MTALRAEKDPGDVMRALSHAGRRRMLELVRDGERTSGELAERCGMTAPAASQHLRVLREAGLVRSRAVGNRRLHALRQERLADLRAFLDGFWGARLQALREAVAEREP